MTLSCKRRTPTYPSGPCKWRGRQYWWEGAPWRLLPQLSLPLLSSHLRSLTCRPLSCPEFMAWVVNGVGFLYMVSRSRLAWSVAVWNVRHKQHIDRWSLWKPMRESTLQRLKIGNILNNVPNLFLKLYVNRYFTIFQLIMDLNANKNCKCVHNRYIMGDFRLRKVVRGAVFMCFWRIFQRGVYLIDWINPLPQACQLVKWRREEGTESPCGKKLRYITIDTFL